MWRGDIQVCVSPDNRDARPSILVDRGRTSVSAWLAPSRRSGSAALAATTAACGAKTRRPSRSGYARVLFAALIAATVAGCADVSGPSGRDAEQRLGALTADLQSYKLGVGDKVRVVVYGEQDLSGTFEVGPQGKIAMPLLGELPAKGLTPSEIRVAVTTRLAGGYLRNPRVTAEVVGYRPYYVHGEVRGGGEFPFKNGIRIRDAVAVAGGYTYRANQTYVLLTRDGIPEEIRIALPSDIIVMPGDNIRVGERFF